MTEKFVPFEKLSKKKQRELNKQQRPNLGQPRPDNTKTGE